MNRSWMCWVAVLGLLPGAGAPGYGAEPAETPGAARQLSPEEIDFFERRVRPVLAEHCYGCHSAKASVVQANLRLDTAAGVRAGGDSGPLADREGETP